MEEKRYVIPPHGDGAGSEPESAGEQVTPNRTPTDFQEEVNAKLDAILAALGINEETIQ